MNDMNLLLVGIFVFGLMLIGMVLTVIEFRQLSNDNSSEAHPKDTDASKRK